MKPIKIGFYCGPWDYAGTARAHERIVQSIDKTKFDPYVFYWPEADNNRLDVLKKFPGVTLVPFSRSQQKTGPEAGYVPLQNNFKQAAGKLDLDILHSARSGYFEFPFNERIAPLQVETNIFGYRDISGFCDKTIAICNYIKDYRGGADAVVYNPTPKPVPGGNLRANLDIPNDALVLGRIGRPGNFHPIGLNAFARLLTECPGTYYLIVAPCLETLDHVKKNRIPNVLFVNETNDDSLIESFYRTIDIMAHYRLDGEICSTAIQQAMAYGLSVVSHKTPHHNGQLETIGGGGFVAEDEDSYLRYLRILAISKSARERVGADGNLIFEERYEQGLVVRKLENLYASWMIR